MKTLVVDCPSMKPLPLRRDWYPDATWVHGLPTHDDFRRWLDGLTHVYTAETAYGTALWDEAERAGVKTVLAVNPEFLDLRDRPTLWAAPSVWRWDTIPANKVLLPVPIDIPQPMPVPQRNSEVRCFVHVVGRPATRDRNGTESLLAALQYVTSTIRVTVTCQEAGYVEGIADGVCVPPNVELVIRSGDVPDNADLYRGQDVLVLPRRFGGLCLPQQEALGHGMPVVMPNISPNDARLPSDWLVDATHAGQFTVKQNLIDYCSVDHRALAQTIDRVASDAGFYAKAKTEALELRNQLSWQKLKPAYLEVLSGL